MVGTYTSEADLTNLGASVIWQAALSGFHSSQFLETKGQRDRGMKTSMIRSCAQSIR
jgi:hypothetical protein